MLKINALYHDDCLNAMQYIDDKSIDMILCDLPYGTTGCRWDIIIPFIPLWEQYNRIIKNDRTICLFSGQPFTTKLISSNFYNFKYELVWEKEQGVNFQLCNKQPLKNHENILIFYNKRHVYFPQNLIECNRIKSNSKKSGDLKRLNNNYLLNKTYIQKYSNYPKSVLNFCHERGLHPTQKPVPLLEYLIKTYTNENDLVLDNCMGSGSTIIAALNTKRNFIGIEKDEKIFNLACNRVENYAMPIL
jgi:site-specific DNA-methyltransferase (adenine-specific)